MAILDINLVPQEIKKEVRVKGRKKSLNFLGAIVLGVTLFSTGVLVLYGATLRRSYETLVNLERKEEQKIKDLEAVERDALRLERKVAALGPILSSRRRYSYLLEVLSDSTPMGVKVAALTAGTKGELSVSGTANSYITLAKFLLSLLEPDLGGKVFTTVDLRSVSLDERAGKARFVITVFVKEGSLAFK